MGFATEVGLDLEFLLYFLDVVDMTVGFDERLHSLLMKRRS
jgi:hypothetical protein